MLRDSFGDFHRSLPEAGDFGAEAVAHRLVTQSWLVPWWVTHAFNPLPKEQAYSMSHSGGLCSYGLLLLGDLKRTALLMVKMHGQEKTEDMDGYGWIWMDMDGYGWIWSLVISMKHPLQKESH